MYQIPSLLTSHPHPKVIPFQWRSPHTTLPSTLFFAVLFSKYLWMVSVCFYFIFIFIFFSLCALFSTRLSSALPSLPTCLKDQVTAQMGVKGCSVMLCIAG